MKGLFNTIIHTDRDAKRLRDLFAIEPCLPASSSSSSSTEAATAAPSDGKPTNTEAANVKVSAGQADQANKLAAALQRPSDVTMIPNQSDSKLLASLREAPQHVIPRYGLAGDTKDK